MFQIGIRLIGVAMMVVIGGTAATAVEEVRLRERVALKSSVVRLSDVAEIGAGGGVQGRNLAVLPLMPAPAPGTQRFLQRREIADLLAAHGVDLRGVRFTGATQVEITSDGDDWKTSQSATMTALAARSNRHAALLAGRAGGSNKPAPDTGRTEELRAELNRLIASYLESRVAQAATWQVSSEVSERHVALFQAAIAPLEVRGGSSPWTGRQRFMATFSTADGAVQLPVYAEIGARSTPVVVAVQPISRGEPITAADVALQAVDHVPVAKNRGAAVASTEELIGMEARQSIRAGDVVYTDQVQPPVLVKRGEMITISSQAGGIRVRTTARARENGARGELVQVESLETRERFEARVVGPREAAVFALARPASIESPEQDNIARRPLQ